MTTGTHVAALAVEHGATVYTTDRDFLRFPGVRRESSRARERGRLTPDI